MPARGGNRSSSQFGFSALKAGERLLEKEEAHESESRLAGFTGCNLSLEIRLQLGKCSVEFVGSSHQLTRLTNAFDRFLENLDGCGHRGQSAGSEIVPLPIPS